MNRRRAELILFKISGLLSIDTMKGNSNGSHNGHDNDVTDLLDSPVALVRGEVVRRVEWVLGWVSGRN